MAKYCVVIFFLLNGTLYPAQGQNAGELDVSFNPGSGANGDVRAIAVQPDGKILIGGDFTTYNGVPCTRMARLHADGSLDLSFIVNAVNAMIHTIVVMDDGRIMVGGLFNVFNGQSHYRIVRLLPNGVTDMSFNAGMGANGTIYSIVLQPDSKILAGGLFSTFNGASHNNIVRLNANGSIDNTFTSSPGANNGIFAVALQPDGKILIGGQFSTYNGTSRKLLARINANGSLDGSFVPTGTGLDGTYVRSITLQNDSRILIAGAFITYNSLTRNRIARINPDGSLDPSFNPTIGLDHIVDAPIVLQPDNYFLLGGQFSSYNGTSRNGIVRIHTNAMLDITFDPGTGALPTFPKGVYALCLQPDGHILLGGTFSTYNGVSRPGIARVLGAPVLPSGNEDVLSSALLAGAGTAGDKNGSGAFANFNNPQNIAYNTLTNKFYVSDAFNHSIREVSPAGEVTVLAGTGDPGLENGETATARFYHPAGLAIDPASGTIYVADKGNHAIRKITGGQVETLAGTGGAAYQDGPAGEAGFNNPTDLACVGTFLYVTDHGNHCIRKIDLSTGMVSTLAGNGTAGFTDGTGTNARFNFPWGITANGSTLYVADYGNHAIRQLSVGSNVSTLAGNGSPGYTDGAGNSARLRYPTGVVANGAKVYFTDYGNHCIRQVSGGTVMTVSGNGTSGQVMGPNSTYRGPLGITTNGFEFFVVDAFGHHVRKLMSP
ncbi:MAG: hypothetical protein KF690_09240 [Bacteroidetes bacterium]|nr:hypothetical protein [Bacteroidota bacterium]